MITQEIDPQAGGSYVRDPETGELTPASVPAPQPTPSAESGPQTEE